MVAAHPAEDDMDSQQAFGQNYLYHEPDIKKSLGMVIHALTCKSEALSKAEQNLLLANQEIHRLKQTLTQVKPPGIHHMC